MRWKLLIIVSFTVALAAFCIWEVTIHLIFGVRPVQRHDWLLLLSALLPLILAALAAIFVYRHTSRRRKTQAAITALLTLILAVGIYIVGSGLSSRTISIPRPCARPPCI